MRNSLIRQNQPKKIGLCVELGLFVHDGSRELTTIRIVDNHVGGNVLCRSATKSDAGGEDEGDRGA